MDPIDVPDLDDMSEMVEKIKLKTDKPTRVMNSVTLDPKIEPRLGNESSTAEQPASSVKTQPNLFGGMKKGFLFGNAGSSKPKIDNTKAKTNTKVKAMSSGEGDIIKPKDSGDPLVLADVQNAMKQNGDLFSNKEWLTEDLLSNVESNEKLFKQLSDPKIARAVDMMQKDPKSAMEYYKNDMEVQLFFKEFYKVLGSHFTKLGDKSESTGATTSVSSPQITEALGSGDEKAMKDILSNPEIREILSRPDIQQLITLLRNNPDEAQKHLSTCDARFRADIAKLVNAGVLGFQSY